MKKILIVLAMPVLFISCGESRKDDTRTKDIPKETTPSTTSMDEVPGIESVLIPLSQADSMIKAYHHSVHFAGNPGQHVSFELDANVLRDYLVIKQDIRKLDVYLAMNDSGITLVYIGAKDSAGIPVEIPYTRQGDTTKYMMDNVFPCPTCPRLSIYQESEEQQNR